MGEKSKKELNFFTDLLAQLTNKSAKHWSVFKNNGRSLEISLMNITILSTHKNYR